MYEPRRSDTIPMSVDKAVRQHYVAGMEDEKTGMREGIGSIIYNRNDYMQNYEGEFVSYNMHGYGEYEMQPPKYKYEGQFYANKKEGYGRSSYASGAYFEGLYRNDQRFGPGVYADAAGYQDVGIWVASKLIRLSRTFEPENAMPRLARRDEDKIRILRYRKIIHLENDKIKSLAEILLESLTHLRNYDKSVQSRAQELYNSLTRDERAPSFNKPRFDERFYGNHSDHLTMDVLMTEEEIQQRISDAVKGAAVEMMVSPSDVTPRSTDPNIDDEMVYPDDVEIDKQMHISERSQGNEGAKIFKDGKQADEEETDYCGIKQIYQKKMRETLLTDKHEEQWNIFNTSFIDAAPTGQDVPEDSSKAGNLGRSDETVSSELEFDDYGRKKIKDLQLTKKVIITDLMAWNNSPVLIELLKHVFKHRNFEKNLSFDISKILAGRRGSFRQEGTHEKAATEMLGACYNGLQTTVFKLILRQNLDVDVADSRGNTGLLLAAARYVLMLYDSQNIQFGRDRIEVIDTLMNLGANVDCINDECLTPLSLCCLRLLELIHDVVDWSKAFLPKTISSDSIVDDDPEVRYKNFEQWHGRISYESLVQKLPKQMDLNPPPFENDPRSRTEHFSGESKFAMSGNAANKELYDLQKQKRQFHSLDDHDSNDVAKRTELRKQKYIFDLLPITGTTNAWKKSNNGSKNNKATEREVKTRKHKRSSKINDLHGDAAHVKEIKNTEVLSKTEKISATISKLLERGADANFAQVPYPVLIMSIFTKMPSLVSELLQHGADPDTTLSKLHYSFTPLMILAVLQPAYEHVLMAEALLKAKANPSLRAGPEYRSDLLERLKRNRSPEFFDDSQGVTALHLLAIRTDMDSNISGHLAQLGRVIYHSGHIKKSDLYQGHSPLSLAILEGNLNAAKTFLQTMCVDVNEQLGADLGSAMLMLQSCMLQELLPPDLLQEFMELLLQHGGCPFASAKVGDLFVCMITWVLNKCLQSLVHESLTIQVLGEEYNQIEYGRKELTKLKNPDFETTIDFKASRKTKKSKGAKHLELPDVKNFVNSMAMVEKVGKEKLIRKIQENFVRELLNSSIMLLSTERQSELLQEMMFKNAQTWMTAEDVAVIMKTMNCPHNSIEKLVRIFVMACAMHQQKTSSEIDTLIKHQTNEIMNRIILPVDEKTEIVTDVDKKEKSNLRPTSVCKPESNIDDNRFRVCFECLTIHGKVLILCPRCKQVYFCSEECNIKSTAQKTSLHQCPVFYRSEWTKLEKVATMSGNDPTSFMLGKFKDSKTHTEVKRSGAQYQETRGGESSLENAKLSDFTTLPRCKDQESKAFVGELSTTKNRDYRKHERHTEDDTKGKLKKGTGQSQTEDDESINMKSKKLQKGGEHEKSGSYDMKSHEKKVNPLFGNEIDGNMKSKKTAQIGDGRETKHAENPVSDKVESQGNEWAKKNRGKKTVTSDLKLEIVNKKRANINSDKIENEINKINKIKPEEDKKQYKNEKDVGNFLTKSNKETIKRLNRLKGIKVDQISTNINIKENSQKKHDVQGIDNVLMTKNKINKELKNNNSNIHSKNHTESDRYMKTHVTMTKSKIKNGMKKTDLNISHKAYEDNNRYIGTNATIARSKFRERMNETDLSISSKKCKENNNRYVESNIPEKYLDWLLKVSRSAGERLDIDMLLMPYVVFAQGDTYFRILAASQCPKFPGNYSLI